jgi:cyclohexyl-isocyanide hydratase
MTHPADQRIEIVALVYPGCTLLDLIGPQTVLADLPGARVRLCWKQRGAVLTDSGASVLADCSLDEAPAAPEVLLVPGGAEATLALLDDVALLQWLRDRGAQASWVTSVCTGSLLLGAAGLLSGYRASCHWAAGEALSLFGAVPSGARVTVDRNRMTGGGVTAGIDFGLCLAAALCGEATARAIQLAMAYAPAPPFASGSPELAGPALTQQVAERYASPLAALALQRAATRLSLTREVQGV